MLGMGISHWPMPREAVDAEIRALAGAADPETRETGDWLWQAFASCHEDTAETRKAIRDALRKANHVMIDLARLGRDFPDAHAANFEERDPFGRGTRLWIRRQRRETTVLLRELGLAEENGSLTSIRVSPPNRRVTYTELVRCVSGAIAHTYAPDPAAEAAWQDRTAPFRAVMTGLTP